MEKFELEIADQNIVVAAFRKPGGTAELFERIAQEARSHVPDVTTKKGRDQIGSLAMKVSKSKTFIEKCGKELVADQKAQIKLIDDDRIATVKKFDELRNEILAPRDAWEQAEKDRVAKHEQFINVIRMTAAICQNPENPWASINIKDSISDLENLVIDSSLEEYEEQAKLAKLESLELLRKSLAQAEQREARLKVEKEAAELRAVQAAENERKRIEAEQFAQAEAARKAEEARLADEAHTKKVCAEALEHLALLPGVNEQLAKSILAAIYKGRIPHVSIKF